MSNKLNKQQETMRVFRTINSTLNRIDKMNTGDRRQAIESLILINERMSDFVINILNALEDARSNKEVCN